MAQHLRIGSVINFGSIYVGATVTNITDAYLELEVPVPESDPDIRVIPWASFSYSTLMVVTD